jgi:hypothetical protein
LVGVAVTGSEKTALFSVAQERGLGSLLVIMLLTQKLVSIVQSWFKRLKARFALWP